MTLHLSDTLRITDTSGAGHLESVCVVCGRSLAHERSDALCYLSAPNVPPHAQFTHHTRHDHLHIAQQSHRQRPPPLPRSHLPSPNTNDESPSTPAASDNNYNTAHSFGWAHMFHGGLMHTHRPAISQPPCTQRIAASIVYCALAHNIFIALAAHSPPVLEYAAAERVCVSVGVWLKHICTRRMHL